MSSLGDRAHFVPSLSRKDRFIGIENPFSVHDRVEWSVNGRNKRIMGGTIELIVPPNYNPRRVMLVAWGSDKGLRTGYRKGSPKTCTHFTYIVKCGTESRPEYKLMSISRLRKVDDGPEKP